MYSWHKLSLATADHSLNILFKLISEDLDISDSRGDSSAVALFVVPVWEHVTITRVTRAAKNGVGSSAPLPLALE